MDKPQRWAFETGVHKMPHNTISERLAALRRWAGELRVALLLCPDDLVFAFGDGTTIRPDMMMKQRADHVPGVPEEELDLVVTDNETGKHARPVPRCRAIQMQLDELEKTIRTVEQHCN